MVHRACLWRDMHRISRLRPPLQVVTGKTWATLGFGSTQYPRFCAAADLCAQLAADAGVSTFLRTGKCDAEGNEEADFRAWVGDLATELHKKELMSVAARDALASQVRPPPLAAGH